MRRQREPRVTRTVLWWGRSDPRYSRNRILRDCLRETGWQVLDHRPPPRPLAALHASVRAPAGVDLVWVPAFRQRDIDAAAAWARRHRVPLLFDPLISAYDKQVGERRKFDADSWRGRRLLSWERERFAHADVVLADTDAHAGYFRDVLGVATERIHVVPVGADEALFSARPWPPREGPLHVLFYGSFLALQGPEIIVAAARATPPELAHWHLLGSGPQLVACRALARDLPAVSFEPWLPYEHLAERIGRAELLLGIFGTGEKAQRVIPNKVYQALACARPVITASSPAYPEELRRDQHGGLLWVPPGDADALAALVVRSSAERDGLRELGERALATYRHHFDRTAVARALAGALAAIGLGQPPA